MRTSLAVALLLISTLAAAQDAPKPLAVALEPLGDRGGGVVAQVFFRFANPRAITEAGLFLEGSFTEAGQVPRNFRFAVPRKDDKLVWSNATVHNGKMVRLTQWAVLPDQRNEMAIVRAFSEGEVEVDVRLILERDYGDSPVLVASATETFTLTKTNRPLPVEIEGDDGIDDATEPAGAVTIRTPRRNAASGLYRVDVDVVPPVKRVEFWIESKKVLARSAPPYTAELDLGNSPVALRAIGYNASGRYVDADAYVLNTNDPLTVKITRTVTADGMCHVKLSVRNTKGTRLKSVVLYAGGKPLYAWDQPPYDLSFSTASLAGVNFLRAAVIDESGQEASDLLALRAM